MATSTAARPIDLASQATWPIVLGDSITATKRSARLTSIRYNHQPKLEQRSSVSRDIRPARSAAGGSVVASIQQDGRKWQYTGKQGSTQDSYVLVLSRDEGGGHNRQATLEKVDLSVALNLSATPGVSDSSRLQHEYHQLSLTHDDDSKNDSAVAAHDSDDTSIPDADNPFDYRHFLDEYATKETPNHGELSKSSTTTIPVVHASSRSATTAAKKRKTAVEASKPAAKRAKPSQQETIKKHDTVPSVRLSRKASMPQQLAVEHNDEDDGELILENDDDAPKSSFGRSQHSAMSMALSGQLGPQQLGPGPISLHSAASSPASRIHSPAPVRDDFVNYEDEELDLGGEDVEDDDVERLDLPSPVQDRALSRRSAADIRADEEDDDDDDDFSKQLEQAMAEQDDDAPSRSMPQEEEESEEE